MTFEQFHTTVERFLAGLRPTVSGILERGVGLQFSDAVFCAQDKARNRLFRVAIHEAVTANHPRVVVDAWCGIWVLGVMALLAWAERCYMIESNPVTIDAAKQFVEQCGLTDRVEFLHADATSCSMPEKVDMLISETITAWLCDEDFVAICRNMKLYLSSSATIIPEKFQIRIKQYDAQNNLLGTSEQMVESRWWFPAQSVQKMSWTQTITYEMDICLYGPHRVTTWSVLSMGNPRTYEIRHHTHPFFDFGK